MIHKWCVPSNAVSDTGRWFCGLLPVVVILCGRAQTHSNHHAFFSLDKLLALRRRRRRWCWCGGIGISLVSAPIWVLARFRLGESAGDPLVLHQSVNLFRGKLIQVYPLRLLAALVVEDHQVRIVALDVVDRQVVVGVGVSLVFYEGLHLLKLV